MRSVIPWVTLFLVLGTVNGLILSKERTLDGGISILLSLAGENPRPARGNYPPLRFQLNRQLPAAALVRGGYLVMAIGGDGVATFRRIYRGGELRSDEHLLFYRKDAELRLGENSFFPGHGEEKQCAGARFAEFKVDRKGRSVLVGLRNADLRRVCE